jgi:hypothetical protein
MRIEDLDGLHVLVQQRGEDPFVAPEAIRWALRRGMRPPEGDHQTDQEPDARRSTRRYPARGDR